MTHVTGDRRDGHGTDTHKPPQPPRTHTPLLVLPGEEGRLRDGRRGQCLLHPAVGPRQGPQAEEGEIAAIVGSADEATGARFKVFIGFSCAHYV